MVLVTARPGITQYDKVGIAGKDEIYPYYALYFQQTPLVLLTF